VKWSSLQKKTLRMNGSAGVLRTLISSFVSGGSVAILADPSKL
jgi:hypothetical protein